MTHVSTISEVLERCNPWPHVANRHVSISQLLSLWRHSHYDFSRLRRSRRLQPAFSLWRHSDYDAAASVLIITSFSLWRRPLLSWPRPSLRTYERQSINHWFIKTVDKPQPFTVDNKIATIKRNTMNA